MQRPSHQCGFTVGNPCNCLFTSLVDISWWAWTRDYVRCWHRRQSVFAITYTSAACGIVGCGPRQSDKHIHHTRPLPPTCPYLFISATNIRQLSRLIGSTAVLSDIALLVTPKISKHKNFVHIGSTFKLLYGIAIASPKSFKIRKTFYYLWHLSHQRSPITSTLYASKNVKLRLQFFSMALH